MAEVIWHARGGQGAFTAARALGAAASLDADKYALAFPTFGPERRGAPMRAYTKISSAPIGDRSAVSVGDIVVYLDDTLFAKGWETEVAEGGTVLLNSRVAHPDPRVVAIDASGLAADILGRPIPNTAFLGAIAAVCDAVTLEDVCEGIRQTMPAKLHDRNIEVVRAAYELVSSRAEERVEGDWVSDTSRTEEPHRVPTTAVKESGAAPEPRGFSAPDRIIPHLQQFTAQPEDFARSTCFQGGFLVSKNAGWRSMRPVIDHTACTMCLTCYMMCPDGTIYKEYVEGDGANARPDAIAIDYDFCKGCGICAKVCPAQCIAMVEEGEPASPVGKEAAR